MFYLDFGPFICEVILNHEQFVFMEWEGQRLLYVCNLDSNSRGIPQNSREHLSSFHLKCRHTLFCKLILMLCETAPDITFFYRASLVSVFCRPHSQQWEDGFAVQWLLCHHSISTSRFHSLVLHTIPSFPLQVHTLLLLDYTS